MYCIPLYRPYNYDTFSCGNFHVSKSIRMDGCFHQCNTGRLTKMCVWKTAVCFSQTTNFHIKKRQRFSIAAPHLSIDKGSAKRKIVASLMVRLLLLTNASGVSRPPLSLYRGLHFYACYNFHFPLCTTRSNWEKNAITRVHLEHQPSSTENNTSAARLLAALPARGANITFLFKFIHPFAFGCGRSRVKGMPELTRRIAQFWFRAEILRSLLVPKKVWKLSGTTEVGWRGFPQHFSRDLGSWEGVFAT